MGLRAIDRRASKRASNGEWPTEQPMITYAHIPAQYAKATARESVKPVELGHASNCGARRPGEAAHPMGYAARPRNNSIS